MPAPVPTTAAFLDPQSNANPSSRRQSDNLVAALLPLLAGTAFLGLLALGLGLPEVDAHVFLLACTSLTFAALVWLLRAATPAAAATGALIAFLIGLSGAACACLAGPSFLARSALIPLAALFLLTFAATRAARPGKLASQSFESDPLESQREARHGRNTAQIIANLGVAALLGGVIAICSQVAPSLAAYAVIALLAALAEATADTVSSELGRRFGGAPILLTTLRPVPAGTDGGISLLGTAAGIFAAAVVTVTGSLVLAFTLTQTLIALAAATAGLFFDSLLGATLERRALLNNDLVNFLSTLFAAAAALLLSLIYYST